MSELEFLPCCWALFGCCLQYWTLLCIDFDVSPFHSFVSKVIQEGSPEIRVLECVPQGSDGISKADLEAALGADLVKVRMVWDTPCFTMPPLLHQHTRY